VVLDHIQQPDLLMRTVLSVAICIFPKYKNKSKCFVVVYVLSVYFSGFLFFGGWGCHRQVGGTRFQVGMELINVGICGVMIKAISMHNTCIMHLGEHLKKHTQ